MKNTVKERRLERGITQTKLAARLGIAQSNLSAVENGRLAPWPKLRRELAELLNVDESKLFPQRRN